MQTPQHLQAILAREFRGNNLILCFVTIVSGVALPCLLDSHFRRMEEQAHHRELKDIDEAVVGHRILA